MRAAALQAPACVRAHVGSWHACRYMRVQVQLHGAYMHVHVIDCIGKKSKPVRRASRMRASRAQDGTSGRRCTRSKRDLNSFVACHRQPLCHSCVGYPHTTQFAGLLRGHLISSQTKLRFVLLDALVSGGNVLAYASLPRVNSTVCSGTSSVAANSSSPPTCCEIPEALSVCTDVERLRPPRLRHRRRSLSR